MELVKIVEMRDRYTGRICVSAEIVERDSVPPEARMTQGRYECTLTGEELQED